MVVRLSLFISSQCPTEACLFMFSSVKLYQWHVGSCSLIALVQYPTVLLFNLIDLLSNPLLHLLRKGLLSLIKLRLVLHCTYIAVQCLASILFSYQESLHKMPPDQV